ncbi:hypothetical protein KIPB_012396, partial [Kipferlia bialata]|eukprot:g12396.t1
MYNIGVHYPQSSRSLANQSSRSLVHRVGSLEEASAQLKSATADIGGTVAQLSESAASTAMELQQNKGVTQSSLSELRQTASITKELVSGVADKYNQTNQVINYMDNLSRDHSTAIAGIRAKIDEMASDSAVQQRNVDARITQHERAIGTIKQK